MTRRSGDRGPEPTVVRPGEEPPAAAELWNRLPAMHPLLGEYIILRQIGAGLANYLIAELDDREFLIVMRNRLRHLRQERSAPAFWRRLRRLIIRESEQTRTAGYDIKRLLAMAGQEPPEGLKDRDFALLAYDQLSRMTAAAKAAIDGEGSLSA
ncbi:MAG: hypothetical protein HKM95_08130 [Inquilinus sp.]|nr:hypothetical protein [Inquilinus sp.]